ncbi:SRPBCC family protein [Sphingobium chlorophenolicum]|uniref:Polyketide cyclase/dehydrase n=1 Tax=Sphingobium chlorophenolicum TaxID=46429 RepID=A0A081RCU8_SPHCR|nr:SRPBCC family protein [Sphingobium chlorophenolicum]KEQ53021.1 Polyketide cyclase/dehydrase precursor [Sphingobium chlorophenolicum]
MKRYRAWIWAGVAMAAPAHSAVTGSSAVGFAVENGVDVSADAATVYRLLGQPARWWNGEHSYSGDATNLSLDPVAGGCFCEKVPGKDGKAGSVEHGRVIHAAPDRQLRLSGALGPLQAEAVTGTLTFDIAPAGKGSRVVMSYVAGGYMRFEAAKIAPVVDKVLAEQLQGLKRAAEAKRP